MALGGVAGAAAWDGARMWVAVDGTLAAFDAEGREVLRRDGPPAVLSLVAGPDGLVAVAGAGVVVWLDGAGERAWPVAGAGALGSPAPVPGVAGATVARGAIWWTSRHDSVLRGNGLEVDLGAPAGAPVCGCAGSVWVSVERALLRVGAWGGETSPPLPAPFGPAALACGDGRLAGASAAGAFVLDPSADADVRRLEVSLAQAPAAVVATPTSVWLFPAGEPAALVVPYR